MRTKSLTIPFLIELLIVLYVFHTTIPVFGYYVPAIVHAAAVFLLYAILAMRDPFFFRNVVRCLPLVGLYLLAIIYRGFSNFVLDFYVLLQLFLFPLLALYLNRYASSNTLKRILLFICASYIITSITTYIGNQIYPLASRNLAAVFQSDDVYMFDVYTKMNIGGFNFIYALVLLTSIVMYMIRCKEIRFLIGLFLLAIISATVIASEYTTALLALLLTVLSLFLMRNSFGEKQITVLMIGILFLVFVYDNFFPYLSNLSKLIGSEQVGSRLNELNDFSVRSSYFEGDLGSRYELYMTSLNSFANSPIWGSPNAVAGGHSLLFDSMAKYGLIGFFAMVLMYSQLFRLFYKPFKGARVYGYGLFALAIAIVLAIVNPKDNLPVLTFTIPIAASFFFKQQEA